MAVSITPEDVQAFCPAAESSSCSALAVYINLVNQADECLDAKQVPDEVQEFLKLSAVCHLSARGQGGTVKSERDMDGASVTWNQYVTDGYGLSGTTFGQDILNSGYADCFPFLNTRPSRFMVSFGRC